MLKLLKAFSFFWLLFECRLGCYFPLTLCSAIPLKVLHARWISDLNSFSFLIMFFYFYFLVVFFEKKIVQYIIFMFSLTRCNNKSFSLFLYPFNIIHTCHTHTIINIKNLRDIHKTHKTKMGRKRGKKQSQIFGALLLFCIRKKMLRFFLFRSLNLQNNLWIDGRSCSFGWCVKATSVAINKACLFALIVIFVVVFKLSVVLVKILVG